jgi:hypothetical protein
VAQADATLHSVIGRTRPADEPGRQPLPGSCLFWPSGGTADTNSGGANRDEGMDDDLSNHPGVAAASAGRGAIAADSDDAAEWRNTARLDAIGLTGPVDMDGAAAQRILGTLISCVRLLLQHTSDAVPRAAISRSAEEIYDDCCAQESASAFLDRIARNRSLYSGYRCDPAQHHCGGSQRVRCGPWQRHGPHLPERL